jgi:hypothetical protein
MSQYDGPEFNGLALNLEGDLERDQKFQIKSLRSRILTCVPLFNNGENT